jgi:hypothetical protein
VAELQAMLSKSSGGGAMVLEEGEEGEEGVPICLAGGDEHALQVNHGSAVGAACAMADEAAPQPKRQRSL